MTNIFITSKNGQLVAEVNGKPAYELCDVIRDIGAGFGDSIDLDWDMDEDGNDINALIDLLYEIGW